MQPPLAPFLVRGLWPATIDPKDQLSRSLWFERFPDPRQSDDSQETPRRDFLEEGIAIKPLHEKPRAWIRFLRRDLRMDWSQMIFAQLQARLLVNAGGGVLEGAGVALDRFSGQPLVPGSAIKGCARRYAIEHLVEQRLNLFDPEDPSSASDNPSPSAALASHLVTFLKIFGWVEADWQSHGPSPNRSRQGNVSDIAFACDKHWDSVRKLAAESIATWLGVRIAPHTPVWQQLPSFSGIAKFLPAYPVHVTLPEPHLDSGSVGKLELDLLAAHHRQYHESVSDDAKAHDTEDPNLVFFPSVAPGQVFVFAALAEDANLAVTARQWLMRGLELFGLGAKTAAGYGWFTDVSELVAPNFALSEQLEPWKVRAQEFDRHPDAVKETEALAFLASGIWEKIKTESYAKTLSKYLAKRQASLTEAVLPWVMKAAHFNKLNSSAQEELALDLSDHIPAIMASQSHFPHTLASAIAYLKTNQLWPSTNED